MHFKTPTELEGRDSIARDGAVNLARLESMNRSARALIEYQLEQVRNSTIEKGAQEREIQALRQGLAAAEELNKALIGSSSWRLTAPIRSIKLAAQVVGRTIEANAFIRKAMRTIRRGLKMDRQNAANYPLPLAQTIQAPPVLPVRLVAFYLPQFHAIPENDAWWGAGFTEWTNVRRGRPRYFGHAQPLIPADLGYYDLLETPGIQKRQAQIAQAYGVEAFCFYFYWFSGKTLLEEPIRRFAADMEIELPYCLCWANENWSRRWDGLDHEVLIAQDHSPEDDLAFIRHIADHLRSPRYLRVNGRPALIVYRPSLLPDPLATVSRWRDWCIGNGIGEIHLAYTQSFESNDPAVYGFDAAIEFPPNNSAPPPVSNLSDIDPHFSGKVYDYRTFPLRAESYSEATYTIYRGVFPGWDNEARRPAVGTSFTGATPELYRRWLTLAAKDTISRFTDPDQRLVFINAWNEWAEGAILEPDARLGYANLQATRDALEIAADGSRGRIVLVVHDGNKHGAQFLALNLAHVLFDVFHYGLDIVLLADGPLMASFRRFGRVHLLKGTADGDEARSLARMLRDGGAIGGICNTTVTGLFLTVLVEAGIPCISLVHEMATLLGAYELHAHAKAITSNASVVVFPANEVRSSFAQFVGQTSLESIIRPQGAYKRNRHSTPTDQAAARRRIRQKFSLPQTSRIVLGVGYGDERKGFDLFAASARKLGAKLGLNVAFIWVGDTVPELAQKALWAARDTLVLTSFQEDTDDFYCAADVYALTSREDPFPTVVLEAFDAGLPVVAFAGSGGFDDLLEQGCGLLAPQFDVDIFTGHLERLLSDDTLAKACGEAGRARLGTDFDFKKYTFDIARLADPALLSVSVVVPNYNYAHYIGPRLSSIAKQTDSAYELIILDDASTDASVEVILSTAPGLDLPWTLLESERNTGSVFMQWLRGVEAAKGDLVWIAEADDLADPHFIATASKAFADPRVVISYVQSRQIDGDGRNLSDNYFSYTDDISSSRWRQPYNADGKEEIRLALSVKNTIPNVSAVLFRRGPLLEVLREQKENLSKQRFAGDWLVYIKLLEKGRVAFNPSPLNVHRRHGAGVTISGLDARQLREILELQQEVRRAYDVPAPLLARARTYAQELYEQFGLSKAPSQNINNDPRFAAYFSSDR